MEFTVLLYSEQYTFNINRLITGSVRSFVKAAYDVRFGVLAAMLWQMHSILGCDTVLLGKQFVKFQRVKVPSRCQEAFTQQHSVTSQKNDILKRPQDGHSKLQIGRTLHVPTHCFACTELWLHMPLQCTVQYSCATLMCYQITAMGTFTANELYPAWSHSILKHTA